MNFQGNVVSISSFTFIQISSGRERERKRREKLMRNVKAKIEDRVIKRDGETKFSASLLNLKAQPLLEIVVSSSGLSTSSIINERGRRRENNYNYPGIPPDSM